MRAPEAASKSRFFGDEGGVTVEMALVVPFLFLIMAGILEFGLAWRDSLSTSNAVRAAARVVSSAGDASTADHQALVALTSALADVPASEIRFAVIYDAGVNGGDVPEQCKSLGASTNAIGGIPNLCNVYGGEWLNTTFDPFNTAPFDGQVGSAGNPRCRSGRADWSFCPLQRESSQRAPGGPDYVGVYVAINHEWVTGVFGASGLDMSDSATMRIEPRWGN